jgi:ATP-binding cassette subfamily B protein
VVLELLAQTLATVGIFGALLYVAISALRGVLTPGEMVLYYQGFQNGFAYLQSALSAGAGLYENSLFLHNYQEFLDLRPSVLPLPPVHAVPQPEEQTIRFHGVSYWYPNSVSPALQDVDLEIGAARVIALVGENGSGKSTLVKLLSRLHDPTSGTITVDGCDLRHLDPKAWRRLVSIIFQDYACYLLSAGENIWLGNVEHPFDLQAVRRAAQASGSDAMISRLPSQYDTLLGNAFADGQELSIGEWQKIAVARAFMRDAGIVVLDEPSSALDPLAEAELFRRFRSLIHGRSAILISHRFSTVQLADYIYVLEKGRIIEHGTHLDLVRAGGTYARMYRAQAQHYQGPLPL